jgi:hypothetical protein
MTTEAHALGPLSLEVGINAGYGTNPDSNAPFNPLGVGLGGRAGVSIFGFYGGVDGEYYLGGSTDENTAFGTVHVSAHTLKYGAQLGYNVGIPFVTIRPQIGLGNLTVSGSATGFPDTSDSSFYVEPGVVGLITLGMYFFGADANALLITGFKDSSGNTSLKTSFTMHGQLGLTF